MGVVVGSGPSFQPYSAGFAGAAVGEHVPSITEVSVSLRHVVGPVGQYEALQECCRDRAS